MLRHPVSALRSAIHYAFPRTSFRLMLARDWHDETELALLPALVDPSRDAIDVGANIGRYARPLSSLAKHVHAFEPHPRLARILRASLDRTVTVRQMAVSEACGSAILHVPIIGGREDEGLAFIDERGEPLECMSIQADMTSLDALALAQVGFVKVDVEGHEMNVLAGASRLIGAERPIFMVEAEERHRPGAVADLLAFFGERAYDGFFVLDRRIYPVSGFTPELQDIRILEACSDTMPRRAIPYVNNFIFLPREMRSSDTVERMMMLLAS